MTSLALTLDPALFDDEDAAEAGELYNVEIDDTDDDFTCEHDDCTEQTLPSVSFLDMAPAQSVMTNCLAHYPAALAHINNLIDQA